MKKGLWRKLLSLPFVAVATFQLGDSAMAQVGAGPPDQRNAWQYETPQGAGIFVRTEGKAWRETTPTSKEYNFVETARTGDRVDLFDAGRPARVRLFADHCELQLGNDQVWQRIYDGRWTAQTSVSAPPLVVLKAICDAVRDYYPALEYVGWRGDEWFQEYAAKVAAAPTREAAFELMDELVCRLNDYHTRLFWPGQPELRSPPLHVEPVLVSGTIPADYGIWAKGYPPLELPALEGVAIAVVSAAQSTGLQPGDQILSVDGVPVRKELTRSWRHAVGSSVAGKLRDASGRMLLGRPDSELKLMVRRAQALQKTALVTVLRSADTAENLVSGREVDGVPIIRIPHWKDSAEEKPVARFDELLEQSRHSPGIIIDVRGNGGGKDEMADQVAGRFLKTPVISFSFIRQAPNSTFDRLIIVANPRGPWRYEGRVAVLTDEGCMSACEHFISRMVEADALVCGTPSSGACGWTRFVDLSGGARLRISRTLPIQTGGIPSPQHGIVPHLWAPRTIDDLRNGKDTALEAALRWVKSDDPLPPRLQPLWRSSQ